MTTLNGTDMTYCGCAQLGSGTDPVEGGALAAVLLQWLLPRARLTFCTSHHAELKELPVSTAARPPLPALPSSCK